MTNTTSLRQNLSKFIAIAKACNKVKGKLKITIAVSVPLHESYSHSWDSGMQSYTYYRWTPSEGFKEIWSPASYSQNGELSYNYERGEDNKFFLPLERGEFILMVAKGHESNDPWREKDSWEYTRVFVGVERSVLNRLALAKRRGKAFAWWKSERYGFGAWSYLKYTKSDKLLSFQWFDDQEKAKIDLSWKDGRANRIRLYKV